MDVPKLFWSFLILKYIKVLNNYGSSSHKKFPIDVFGRKHPRTYRNVKSWELFSLIHSFLLIYSFLLR